MATPPNKSPRATPLPRIPSSASAGSPASAVKNAFKPVIKKDINPVPIRSSGVGGQLPSHEKTPISAGHTARFAPRLEPSPSARVKLERSALSGASRGGTDFDVGSALAHSLALHNAQAGVRPGSHVDLALRRGNALGVGAGGRNAAIAATANQKLQQHLQNLRKKKKGRKSLNITELSWTEGPGGIPLYTPVSLPYIGAVADGDDADSTVSKRPTAKLLDEANRHAAALFDLTPEEIEEYGEDHNWFLVQFPGVLPSFLGTTVPAEENARTDDGDGDEQQVSVEQHQGGTAGGTLQNDSTQRTTLHGLPEGFLGTLEIHQSGKVGLRIGEHVFDVNQGSDCNFAQEVACLIGHNKELMLMGRCQKRMVVTPAFDHYVHVEDKLH